MRYPCHREHTHTHTQKKDEETSHFNNDIYTANEICGAGTFALLNKTINDTWCCYRSPRIISHPNEMKSIGLRGCRSENAPAAIRWRKGETCRSCHSGLPQAYIIATAPHSSLQWGQSVNMQLYLAGVSVLVSVAQTNLYSDHTQTHTHTEYIGSYFLEHSNSTYRTL